MRRLALALVLVGCGTRSAPPPEPAREPATARETEAEAETETEPAGRPPSYGDAELDAMEEPELQAACFAGSTAACDRLGH